LDKDKIKVVNYFSDFGPANFWSNISKDKIISDILFIKGAGFNSIIIMLPYASFKPNINNFDSEYIEIFDFLISICVNNDIKVILRIGYLWEEIPYNDRTFERYKLIYKYIDSFSFRNPFSSKSNGKRLFDDYISFLKYYSSKKEIYESFISWEDFFWPIKYETGLDSDEKLDQETGKILRLILDTTKSHKIHIEHRTNAHCNTVKTKYSKTHYGYFNAGSICHYWYNLISEKLKQKTIIYQNLTMEKNFLEWLSRLIITFELKNPENKFILNQFNFYDNSLEDLKGSAFHRHLLDKHDIDRAVSFLEFVQPLASRYFCGIGFWNLWSTISGQIYNGCFVHGLKGWSTTGKFLHKDLTLYLGKNDELNTKLGYIRIADHSEINFCIEYKPSANCVLHIYLGTSFKKIKIRPDSHSVKLRFDSFKQRTLRIVCKCNENQGIEITRVDAWKNTHDSMIFDYERKPTDLWFKSVKKFIEDF
tara:strand:- start:2703 stop:4136 length:1434 start_codon:yes stop_codon:yes gene_type:complete